jgi:hypothetical protein
MIVIPGLALPMPVSPQYVLLEFAGTWATASHVVPLLLM